MEVTLSKLDDPIGFLLNVLKNQASVLAIIQEHPKSSIALMASENTKVIAECHRSVDVAYGLLRNAVLEVGTSNADTMHDEADKLQEVLGIAHRTAQRALSLFDDLSIRYSLPENEPLLFRKIGTLLYE